jgi:hypothetical protein
LVPIEPLAECAALTAASRAGIGICGKLINFACGGGTSPTLDPFLRGFLPQTDRPSRWRVGPLIAPFSFHMACALLIAFLLALNWSAVTCGMSTSRLCRDRGEELRPVDDSRLRKANSGEQLRDWPELTEAERDGTRRKRNLSHAYYQAGPIGSRLRSGCIGARTGIRRSAPSPEERSRIETMLRNQASHTGAKSNSMTSLTPGRLTTPIRPTVTGTI